MQVSKRFILIGTKLRMMISSNIRIYSMGRRLRLHSVEWVDARMTDTTNIYHCNSIISKYITVVAHAIQ